MPKRSEDERIVTVNDQRVRVVHNALYDEFLAGAQSRMQQFGWTILSGFSFDLDGKVVSSEEGLYYEGGFIMHGPDVSVRLSTGRYTIGNSEEEVRAEGLLQDFVHVTILARELGITGWNMWNVSTFEHFDMARIAEREGLLPVGTFGTIDHGSARRQSQLGMVLAGRRALLPGKTGQ